MGHPGLSFQDIWGFRDDLDDAITSSALSQEIDIVLACRVLEWCLVFFQTEIQLESKEKSAFFLVN